MPRIGEIYIINSIKIEVLRAIYITSHMLKARVNEERGWKGLKLRDCATFLFRNSPMILIVKYRNQAYQSDCKFAQCYALAALAVKEHDLGALEADFDLCSDLEQGVAEYNTGEKEAVDCNLDC